MQDSSSARNPVECLAEEFVERYRNGERPPVREYLDRYPEHAAEIEELFPALMVMERFKPESGDGTGSFHGGKASKEPAIERIGDYRVLREVGRGGMGIVYEAEQLSLGRRVALKVLPGSAMLDAKQRVRFLREAKAAARLHHTNIVPVFGVGEENGLHYYVMQFIQGQGLDLVLKELKRLQATPGTALEPGATAAGVVANELLTGDYGSPISALSDPSAITLDQAAQTARTGLTHSGRHYYRCVAHIGAQVAEALSHANAQGILHRDVKPSNLLLDHQGHVWVTDFGLAKAIGDREELTHTGDIVGTVRYMAPERFHGRCDARSDVYALGLTLYELITKRPAFAATDRNQLVRQVTQDEPPRLRRLDPAVPRDLETIIHKAIEKEPAHRYSSAAALAEDLKRFVDDRSIAARRASPVERLWRWCRRNPALAGSLAAAVLIFCVGFVLVAWKWQDERTARGAAVAAQKDTETKARELQQTIERMNEANGLIERAIYYAMENRLAEAARLHTRAIEVRPDHARCWEARGTFYGRMGLWDLAAADFEQAARLQPPESNALGSSHALLRLWAGDLEGYRRARATLLEQARIPGPVVPIYAVRAAALGPGDGAELMPLLKQVEKGTAGNGEWLPWAKYVIGGGYYRAGQYNAAIPWLRRAQQVTPDQWVESALVDPVLAMAHFRLGNMEEARQALTTARAAYELHMKKVFRPDGSYVPWDERFWYDWTEFLWLFREARTLIENNPPPEDARLIAVRGRALAALGRRDDAAKEFARAVQLEPRDPEIHFACFHFHAKAGRWDEAASELASACELAPRPQEFRLGAFEVYAENERWDDAEVELAQAVRLQPDNSLVRMHAVIYYAGKGDWDRAAAAYARLAAERPQDANLRIEFANRLMSKKEDYARAAAVLAEATRLVPDHAHAWNQLGVCHYRLREWHEASVAFSKAIELMPANGVHASNRGVCYAELGKWKLAVDDFARVVELNPGSLRGRCDYALACLAAGQMQEYRQACTAIFQNVRNSSKGDDPAMAFSAIIAGPDALANQAELVKWLERSQGSNERNAKYLRLLGAACCRAGQYERAVELLRRATTVNGSEEANDALFLALAQHYIGNAKEARQALQRGTAAVAEAEKVWARTPNLRRRWFDLVALRLLHHEVESVVGQE